MATDHKWQLTPNNYPICGRTSRIVVQQTEIHTRHGVQFPDIDRHIILLRFTLKLKPNGFEEALRD